MSQGQGVQSLMQLKIVAGALMWSVVIYVGVVYFLFEMNPDPDRVGDDTLFLPMAGAAAATIVALPIVRSKLLGGLALPFLSGETPTTAQTDEQRAQALGTYFVGTIVSLAIAESVAVFGFVAAFLGADWTTILPFAGAALVLMGAMFPSEKGLQAVAAA